MRVLIMILLFPFVAHSQRYVGNISTPNAIGDLFVSNMSNASDFTRTGSDGTWNYSANGLTTSGTGVNTTTNILEYSNWHTNLEKVAYEITFVANSDGYGVGVAHIYYATSGIGGVIAKVSLTGSNKGQLYINELFQPGSESTLATSGTTYFPITNGKTYTLTLLKHADALFCIIKDIANGNSQTLKYSMSYTVASFVGWKAGRAAFCWYGGSQTISKLREYSWIPKNTQALWLGDSNMQGLGANHWYDRYFEKAQLYFKSYIAMDAGSGNKSSDVVDLLPEVVKIKPASVVINIGTNGITSANIDTIVNVCVRNNIHVFLITILPKLTGNMDNTIIRAKVGVEGVTVIDNEAAMDNSEGTALDSAYSNPDSPIHLNEAGHYQFYLSLVTPLSTYLIPR